MTRDSPTLDDLYGPGAQDADDEAFASELVATPGPWEAVAGGEGPDEHWSIFVDDEELAAVYLASGKQQANARLIAAAPELLDALRDLLATLGDTAIVPPEQLVAARDAIAKAEA